MADSVGTILVVDDEPEMRELVRDVLQERGHQVTLAENGREALKRLGEADYGVVLSDLRMRGMEGIELLTEIKRAYPDTNVILMTAFGSVETAVEAMKEGAYDYLVKPVKTEELIRVTERAVREAALRREVNRLRRAVRTEYSFHQILGKSKAMQEVFDLIRRVADSPTNVLITGESGTGKELVAKAIHYNSDRRDAPFVPVNCAAIPETLLEAELFGYEAGAFTDARRAKPGLFEAAAGGTLFLDEIGDMPFEVQAKLLRVLQDGTFKRLGGLQTLRVNVRVIAATNKELSKEVAAERFRSALRNEGVNPGRLRSAAAAPSTPGSHLVMSCGVRSGMRASAGKPWKISSSIRRSLIPAPSMKTHVVPSFGLDAIRYPVLRRVAAGVCMVIRVGTKTCFPDLPRLSHHVPCDGGFDRSGLGGRPGRADENRHQDYPRPRHDKRGPGSG